jgi:hypothetical protein
MLSFSFLDEKKALFIAMILSLLLALRLGFRRRA